jgi:branched-subunit amino acid transport protein
LKTELVWLAAMMALVTYPGRALPLLVPDVQRMPLAMQRYLRLVAPAVLAGLASVSLTLSSTATGATTFQIGPEWLSVAVCLVMVRWRRSLLLGLVFAAGLLALLRATGLAVPR